MGDSLFESYCQAWSSHDGDAVVSLFAPDAVFEDTTLGERAEGRDAIRAFVERAPREFSSDLRLDMTSFVGTETGFAAEWTLHGTHDRSSARLPATGRPYAIHGVSIGRLENGRIKENHDYWNMVAFLVQIGLMPGPA